MKQFLKFFKHTALFFGIVLIAVVALSSGHTPFARGVLSYEAQIASAATTGVTSADLKGFAWSDTIGWISFNCVTDQHCNHDYKVSADATNRLTGGSGDLSGFAWSPNIGWISFNQSDLRGCPEGSCSAQINWATGKITGWAIARAGMGRTDGWDGWIKLSGVATNHEQSSYGPVLNQATGKFSGFSWGSEVVGWVAWDYALAGGGRGGVSIDLTPTTLAAPANLKAVPVGTCPPSIQLTWDSVPGVGVTYDVYRVGAALPIAKGLTALTYKDFAITGGTAYTYTVVAHQGALTSPPSTPASATAKVCPSNPIGVTLTINGVSAVRVSTGSTVNLAWTTSGNPAKCTATAVGDGTTTWTRVPSKDPAGGSEAVVFHVPTTYTITCYEKPDGTGNRNSASVNAYPRADFNITPQ